MTLFTLSTSFVVFALHIIGGYKIPCRTSAKQLWRHTTLAASARDPELAAKLKTCLSKEYASFFSYMESDLYCKDMVFIDPLNKLKGLDKYKSNIDMLAGRTLIGSKVFRDSSLQLHNSECLPDGRYQTRWTLSSIILFLPWRPRMEFTGVSRYTVSSDGFIEKQEDFWDSINLQEGKYAQADFSSAIRDFLGQLKPRIRAEMVAPELPYTLLRRAANYEVRRYAATLHAETRYQQRPEGYDRLGSYVSGSNSLGIKVPYLAPMLMRIPKTVVQHDDSASVPKSKEKTMSWPLSYAATDNGQGVTSPPGLQYPNSTVPGVALREYPAVVVAVLRFSVPATETVAHGYTNNLLQYVQRDGLVPSSAALAGDCIVAQYDALFSLNKRRNEVWVKLDAHDW